MWVRVMLRQGCANRLPPASPIAIVRKVHFVTRGNAHEARILCIAVTIQVVHLVQLAMVRLPIHRAAVLCCVRRLVIVQKGKTV
jgi:hypothetical protein